MKGYPSEFWGKLAVGEMSEWHPLRDHCADVAAMCEALLARTLLGKRLAVLGNRTDLTVIDIQRMAALAAFHDVGKFNHGFQNKADSGRQPRAGHVGEVLQLLGFSEGIEWLRPHLPLDEINDWADQEEGCRLLVAAIAHHGKPLEAGGGSGPKHNLWKAHDGRDPLAGINDLNARVRRWFPDAFSRRAPPLPSSTLFQHGFCGLVTLADWIGSNREFFPYSENLHQDRMEFARSAARRALRNIAIDASFSRKSLSAARPEFSAIAQFEPNAAQQILLELPLVDGGSLEILESETGSGKTEAALARFLSLFQAGKIDGLYFALPTRTAAVQIHQRIDAAITRAFPDPASRPPVILAVPGYLPLDRTEPFLSLWSDDDRERYRFRYWASEHPKRYLAGAVSIGTIDQVLLSSLAVAHSHMRAAALSRQLLVVDEVHASDAYMTRILRAVLKFHAQAGGYALLLSATLGAEARSRLRDCVALRQQPTPTLAEANVIPYPVLTSITPGQPPAMVRIDAAELCTRTLNIKLLPIASDHREIAAHALEAARCGGRILIVRNTVRDCVTTQLTLEAMASDGRDRELCFSLKGVFAPHHARFVRDDRTALDRELEVRFGRKSHAPCIVAATQTVQQSLDLDADLILTDLCPIDVMLQRAGRLQRHQRNRPDRFRSAQLIVLTPLDRDLTGLIRRDGHARGDHGFGTVYDSLPILEAAWRILEQHPVMHIPAMNRVLVEAGTHPEALGRIVAELGGPWKKHWSAVNGAILADRKIADLNLVERDKEFGDYAFPSSLDQRIRTRLGQGDRIIDFTDCKQSLASPFGSRINQLAAPAWFVLDAPENAKPEVITSEAGVIKFRFGARNFIYDRMGLRPNAAQSAIEDDQADA
jgi:CRISPR-associated endonuclease/helicase Cas3